MTKGLYIRTDLIKKKMSISHLGQKRTLEMRENYRRSKLGNKNPNFGKKHTLEWRRRMSDKKKGSNAPNWKGGVTKKSIAIRRSLEYRLWRTAVFERDNYTCVLCDTKESPFNADHIKSFALFPELRFSIDNGRTLCVPCHKKTDTYPKNLLQKIWVKYTTSA